MQVFTFNRTSIQLTFVFLTLMIFCSTNNVFGQRNITVTTSATSGGSWSGGLTGPYTFTPNADNANIADTAIQNRFLGTGTYNSNSVTIVTSGGGGSQAGNVSINTALTANNTTETQYAFTVTADGNISTSGTLDFSGLNTGGADDTRRTGKNILFTAGGSISIGAAILTSGGRRGTIGGGAAGDITLTATTTLSVTANLTLNGADAATDANSNRVGGNAGDITLTGPSGITISGSITADGGNNHGNLAPGIGGIISFTASSGITMSGNITANGGNGENVADGADGNVIVDISATTVTSGGVNDGQTGGVINIGSGTFTKNGAGTFLMKGINTYTGVTTISNGTIRLGATGTSPNGPLGTTGGNTVVSSGAVLDLNGFNLATAEALTLNGSGISSGGALINSSGTTASYSGTITLNSASSIGGSGNITITTITGIQDLTKVGSGTLNMGSGTVTLPNLTISAGTLTATSGTTNLTGDLSNSGTFTHNSGTVNFNGTGAQAITGSSTSTFNNITIDKTAGTLTVATNENVSGSLTFTNTGSTLSVSSTKTLAITGALILNNAAGNTNVTAVITGTGTLTSGSISVGNGTALTTPNSTTRTTTLTSTISTLTVAGNLAINSYFAATARVNNGVFNLESGIATVDGSVTTSNPNGANTPTFSMATGAQTATFKSSGATPFSLSGTGTNTINLNGSGSTVEYSGTTAQTAFATTYRNLVISNSNALGVTFSGASTINGTTTVNAGSLLITSATLTTSGGATINGDFQLNGGGFATGGTWVYGAAGKLKFNSSYTVSSGHVYFPSSNGPAKVFVTAGTVDFGSLTRTISDTFSVGATIINYCNFTLNGVTALQSGGSFGTSCGSGLPTYGCTSTFKYNTGANPQIRGNEWPTTATLGNVEISNNTTVNGNIGNGTICGNLTISAGSSLYMDYGSSGSSGLTVGKDIVINGNLSLGFSGGDLTVGGNWTHASSGSTINFRGRAVVFNGTGTQVITKTGGGTEDFNGSGGNAYFLINKTSGNVQLAAGTDITMGQTAGDVLQINNSGGLDLNGRTFTMTGNGGNISPNASGRIITSVTGRGNFIISGSKTVAGAGTVSFSANVTVKLAAAMNFGSSKTTINDTLQINNGGSVITNAPIYGSSSTLVYNQTGTPTFGTEWTGNSTTAGTGIPQNVAIQNSTTLNMPNSDRGLAGNLNIISGALVLNASSGDLYIGGSWTRNSSATFTPNSRAVFFNGVNNTQTISVTGGGTETFNYLLIDKTTGGNVTLSNNPATNVIVNATAGNVFEIKNSGGLDLNGQIFTLSGSGGNIFANGGTRNIIGTGGGTFNITGNKVVTGTALVFASSDTVAVTAASINFGSSITTINGTLKINSGGSVVTNPPTYGNTSLLIYNQTGSQTLGLEWNSTSATAGLGVPQNVTIQNNTTLTTSANRALSGILSVANGSTLILGAGYTAGSTSIAGILQLNAGGSVTPTATYSGTSSTLIYNQSGTPAFGGEWGGNGVTAGVGVPQNIIIQNSTIVNMPSADRGLAGDLNINNGTLNMNASSGNLFVGGNWTRTSNGIFIHNNRNVTFNGTSNSIITAPNAASRNFYGVYGGEKFYDLTINKNSISTTVSTGLSITATNISVRHTLALTNGTFNLGDSNLILISKFDTTADVGTINSTNAAITYSGVGRVCAQRFIANPAPRQVRTWRYLTAPFQANDPVTINQAWQGGVTSGNPSPGYSTAITGPGGVTNGFDASPNNNYSIQWFNNTGAVNAWGYPTNTSERLMSKPAWVIFIRGDRSASFTGPYNAANDVVLEPKGKINVGDTTYTIISGKFSLIGNPYPARVNMLTVTDALNNPHPPFKLWDPQAFQSYAQTGAYIKFMYLAGAYVQSNNAGTTWSQPGTVESGEAIMIDTVLKSTAIKFHETDKMTGTSTQNGLSSRPASPTAQLSTFYTKLGFYDINNAQYKNIDGVSNLYHFDFNPNVLADEDYIAPTTVLGSVRILKAGIQLYLDAEPSIQAGDTIYLKTNISQGQHRLAFYSKNLDANLQPWAIDRYAGTELPIIINNTDSTFLYFTVTADAQSNRSDRFMVVFRSLAGPLPVKFSSIKAAKQTNVIAVEWKVATETNIKSYTVERSTNGVDFTAIKTISSTNASAYNYLDVSPNNGDNYYRIRSVDQSGNATYSQIVLVKDIAAISSINVSPNTIENNIINLQFTNQINGKYKIRLINAVGQLIHATEIKVNSNAYSEAVTVPAVLSKGMYQLEINTPDNKKIVKKVMMK